MLKKGMIIIKENFNQLLKLDTKNLQKFYNDLINKHFQNDFLNITSEASDPKTHRTIIVKYEDLTNKDSKKVIDELYKESLDTVNKLNDDFHYNSQPQKNDYLILFTETQPKNNKDDQPIKISQVIPFNLKLLFAIPITFENQQLTVDGLDQEINKRVHAYIQNIMYEWLTIPWLIHFQLKHQPSNDQIYDHAFSEYQINYFNESLKCTFKLEQPADITEFNEFLSNLPMPDHVTITSDEKTNEYHMSIN